MKFIYAIIFSFGFKKTLKSNFSGHDLKYLIHYILI